VFTLHDGPPYANGALHVGHALNKILKDIINKHALLRGKRARFVPGWDCHGLPIELKVLQAMGQGERRGLTPLDLRRKAHAYALEQVDNQRQGFRRWGIWADWEQPYLTLNKEYEAAQIGVFGQMVAAGHIYRGLKPVHWSPSSRTALAEAELEYPDGHTSPSVYVAFPVVEVPGGPGGATGEGGHQRPLAGGSGAAAGGDLDHHPLDPARQPGGVGEWPAGVRHLPRWSWIRRQRLPSHRYLVVAADLVESLGARLEHPLEPVLRPQRGGTGGDDLPPPAAGAHQSGGGGGRVHHHRIGHGPGPHGAGPWRGRLHTAKAHGLAVLCPVDEAGVLTAEAGPFAGLNVLKDANAAIITALGEPRAPCWPNSATSTAIPTTGAPKNPPSSGPPSSGSPRWRGSGSGPWRPSPRSTGCRPAAATASRRWCGTGAIGASPGNGPGGCRSRSSITATPAKRCSTPTPSPTSRS
jgi:isoleucyl-tRNA synthetase